MGYYLLDNRNPNARDGFHGYSSRNSNVTAIVLHTAETNPTSSSATNIGNYFASTSTPVSYHRGYDSSGVIRYLPLSYTGFHVRGFNSPSVGVSWCTFHNRWGRHPGNWERQALEHGGRDIAAIASEFDIPLRRISANQARNGTKGIVTHAEMDPSRRVDPGPNFPSDVMMSIARDGKAEESTRILEHGMRGGDVLDWQNQLMKWRDDALPEFGADGHYGDETLEWTLRFMREVMGVDDAQGRVGPRTREAMKEKLMSDPDFHVAVVAKRDTVDEGAARVLGRMSTWKYLDESEVENYYVKTGVCVGPVDDDVQEKFDDTRILRGASREDTVDKVVEYMEKDSTSREAPEV